MQPGGFYPRANASNYGKHGNGGGFRDGSGQPYRPPTAQQEVTPREKEEVLLAAGRLAAEYLVSRGELPPDALDNRPPPPFPSRQPAPRAFHHFQGRPPAPHHRNFQWELRPHVPHQRRQSWPRPFQGGGPGPFPKRPRYSAPRRPYPYGGGPRGPAPPKPGYAGQGVAAPATASKAEKDNEHSAPAGDVTSDWPPTAQPATGVSVNPQLPADEPAEQQFRRRQP